jgi:hypothetical protein
VEFSTSQSLRTTFHILRLGLGVIFFAHGAQKMLGMVRWIWLHRHDGFLHGNVAQHLTGLLDAKVKVTIEIEAELPSGAPENVVRTVTENCRTLKFDSQGFEET